MMRKLMMGVFVTAVAALPLTARADWNDLKTRGAKLEQQGKELEAKGKADEEAGKRDVAAGQHAYDQGKVVEKKTVTTYKKGRNYAKTTTTKVHRQ